MRVLAVIIILVLGAFSGWQAIEIQAQSTQLAALSERVDDLESQLNHTQNALSNMENNSLERQVQRANKKLLDGWQSLLKGLQEGVDASRDALEEKELIDNTPPAGDTLERT